VSDLGAPRAGQPRRDLEASLGEVLGSRREARWVLEDVAAGTGEMVPEDRVELAGRLVERRRNGEPLQYVLGHWPFRHLDLVVDGRALIPRPETEWLIDVALSELDRLVAAGAPPIVADLGTGTGAIALAIATERADHVVSVIATDNDPGALEVARTNTTRLAGLPGVAKVSLRLGAWWDAFEETERGTVTLVVSNPPYVAAAEWEGLDPVVRDHEPYRALVAGYGSDGTPGLAAVETIVEGASSWLARPGALVVEIAPGQGDAALLCAERAGALEAVVLDDLAGRPRALLARFG